MSFQEMRVPFAEFGSRIVFRPTSSDIGNERLYTSDNYTALLQTNVCAVLSFARILMMFLKTTDVKQDGSLPIVLQTRKGTIKTTAERLRACNSDMLDTSLKDDFGPTFDRAGRRVLKLDDFEHKVFKDTLKRMETGRINTSPKVDTAFVQEQHRQLDYLLHRPTQGNRDALLQAEKEAVASRKHLRKNAKKLKREKMADRAWRTSAVMLYVLAVVPARAVGGVLGGSVGAAVGCLLSPAVLCEAMIEEEDPGCVACVCCAPVGLALLAIRNTCVGCFAGAQVGACIDMTRKGDDD